jgi:hypothetical protein
MEMTGEQLGGKRHLYGATARLTRYFLTSKKDFISGFLKAVIEVEEEFDKASGKATRKVAKTEEEEEEQMKERRAEGKKRESEKTAKVLAKACPWSDKEWQALETAFAAAMK